MKTIIATVIALTATTAAPAFADTAAARAFIALGNDSAAERIVRNNTGGGRGDLELTLRAGVSANESAAERRNTRLATKRVSRFHPVSRNNQARFALGNDSAAERILN